MSDNTPGIAGATDERQSAPAGIATEITAMAALPAASVADFGHWLAGKVGSDPEVRGRLAMHSGLPAADLLTLLTGQRGGALNRDQVQRIASALVEMQIIPHADEAWNAVGLGGCDTIIPPLQIVQAMSRGT